MKHVISLGIIVSFYLLTLSGCQNNGDIGDLYGQWKIIRIECEGDASLPGEYENNIFWSFQNQTICVTGVWEYYNSLDYGNWRIEDNTFFYSFPDKEFAPPVILSLPREGKLQIVKLTGSEFILTYHPDLDSSITYYLKKW